MHGARRHPGGPLGSYEITALVIYTIGLLECRICQCLDLPRGLGKSPLVGPYDTEHFEKLAGTRWRPVRTPARAPTT